MVDLVGLTVTDTAEPANRIDEFRNVSSPGPLEVLPGSRLALDVLTDAPGYEDQIEYRIVPAAGAIPSQGTFPLAGGALVQITDSPAYFIVVFHDKNGDGLANGNDPIIIATVVTSAPPIDHLRIYVDGDELLPSEEPGNGHVGEQFVVTARGAWSGLDGVPFTGDDLILDDVSIAGEETRTVLFDAPNPGGGPPVLSATAAMTQRSAVKPPAPPAGPPGG